MRLDWDQRRPERPGSLGYQLLQVMKAVFRPGTSRHTAKRRGDAEVLNFGKETMRKYVAQGFELAAYLKAEFPACRRPTEITSEMCECFMETLVDRGLAGGTLGRYAAFIRKLDRALRYLRQVPDDAPPLLPTLEQGGDWNFRANTSTLAYSDAEALALLAQIRARGSEKYKAVAAQVVELMLATGLRIQEAGYLRADGIGLVTRQVRLVKNTSRTKGGKPRVTAPYHPAFDDFMAALKVQGEGRPDDYGCVFRDRASLPGHVRAEIRRACRALGIQQLGSHGFRKLNAQTLYAELRAAGLDDEAARLTVAWHLGHNRVRVTVQSYVEAQRQRG
ncbi:MAG: tyrosine-type recombinase/integrase [Anaerolineales bacterium]|nr:tyrosine-type recombinase/integrase [Anaerolineales bacterium]